MEYYNFLKFYENIIRNLNWVLQPRVNDKNKRICGVYNECNLCGQEIHPAIEFMYGTNLDESFLREHVKGLLNSMLMEQFHMNKDTANAKQCKCLKDNNVLQEFIEVRDREWLHVQYEEQFMSVRKKLFGKLMLMILQVHLEMVPIINSFSWYSYSRSFSSQSTRIRSITQPRLASIVPFTVKKQMTVNAVMGKNDSLIRKTIMEKTRTKTSIHSVKRRCQDWTGFLDDLIFLKHLSAIGYINVNSFYNFEKKLLPTVTNKDAYKSNQNIYFIGYPANNKKRNVGKHLRNKGEYDQNTSGSVRFLEEKWVEKYCPPDYVKRLKEEENRTKIIPTTTKNEIIEEMKRLRELHCTHVYKFTCEITMERTFCNVVVSEKKDRNNPYTYMKEDIITNIKIYKHSFTFINDIRNTGSN